MPLGLTNKHNAYFKIEVNQDFIVENLTIVQDEDENDYIRVDNLLDLLAQNELIIKCNHPAHFTVSFDGPKLFDIGKRYSSSSGE